MKSIITHFYNEEYLLPWWLEHHKKIFDYGLMINYNSTDRSVEIIKDICPDWQIVDSVNPEFSAIEVDKEVMYYEEQIPGWKICLNVPEFLYGDFSSLRDDQNQVHFAPCLYFVDDQNSSEPDKNKPLHEQYSFGCDYKDRNLDHHHRAALWSTGWAWFIYCRARLTKLDSEESKPTRSKTKVSA